MNDFFKYTSVNEEDIAWGLFLNVVGKSTTQPNKTYPSPEHPNGYYFQWEKGRILNEYQINYITNGYGTLENNRGTFRVKPGTLMIIRKDEWHRYKPDTDQTWTENYIGFDGAFTDHFLKKNSILKGQSVIYCGIREDLLDTYYKIFDLVKNETPGNQLIASGMVIKLLGYIVAWEKQKDFSGNPIEQFIQESRYHMRKHVDEEIDLEKLAQDKCLSYSYFRKMFKKYTGVSPHQYHLDLKLIRAKELLLTSNMTIKEISYKLGFQSVHYFSRIFKNKMGCPPSDIRKTL